MKSSLRENINTSRMLLPVLLLGSLAGLLILCQCKKDEKELENNSPPRAGISFSPLSGTTATVFSFDASPCQDTEDALSLLQVRWDWEGDGTWDTPFSTQKTTSYQHSHAGSYTLRLEVKDSGGLTDIKDTIILVTDPPPVNTPPVAKFTVSPSVGTTVSVYTMDASMSYDAQDSTHLLQFRWDWDNDGTWDTPFSNTQTATQQFSQIGSQTIRLEVKDSGGLTSTDQQTAQITAVTANTPPVAIFSVNPTSQPEYSVFYFNASASYDNEDPSSWLNVRWDWDNDGIWDTGYQPNKSKSYTYTQSGTYTIRMEVKDSGGLTDDTTATITVTPLPNGVPCPTVPTVTYGGQTYNTVKIGIQCWMKENLNIGTLIPDNTLPQTNNGIIEKYCGPIIQNPMPQYPLGVDSMCAIYGGLYRWHEAMGYTTVEGAQGICPPGWHIPTDNEWKILEGTVDTQYGVGDPMWDSFDWGNNRGFDAAGHLKTSGYTYWNPPNSCGTNSSGFSAISTMVAAIQPNGFIPVALGKDQSRWWTSTIYEEAIWRHLGYSSCGMTRLTSHPDYAISIRCIKDN